jgi:hypothetical protein
MYLIDSLMIGLHSHPMRIFLGEFLEFPVCFANFLLEFDFLVALLPIV